VQARLASLSQTQFQASAQKRGSNAAFWRMLPKCRESMRVAAVKNAAKEAMSDCFLLSTAGRSRLNLYDASLAAVWLQLPML